MPAASFYAVGDTWSEATPTYTQKTATLKILGGDIPSDLLYDEAPVDPQVWESSRVFVAESVPMNMRRTVHAALIGEMARSARECGASRLIGMISSVWPATS